MGHYRFAWDFETLEHYGIGFEAIQKPSHNYAEVEYCIDGQDWWRPVESPYVNMTK